MQKEQPHNPGNMTKSLTGSDDFLTIYTHVSQLPIFLFPHRLERAVFALCVQGEMRVQVDLKEYTIQANDFMLAAPGQLVQAYDSSADFQGFCFAADREFTIENRMDMEDLLPLFFYLKEHPVTHISNSERRIMEEYLGLLQRKMLIPPGPYRRNIVYHLVRAFLFEMNHILHVRAVIHNKTKSRKEIQFETFMQNIAKHSRENRSVMFYADLMCLSPKHLSRVIREVSGHSAGDWIDAYVVMEAKTLLKTSRLTVDEISMKLNFPNQSFFGKYFKQHTGMTPLQYRNT